MARPTEYDNLLKIGQLKEPESSQDSIQPVRANRAGHARRRPTNARTSTKCYLAYEGMFNIVMAALEFYGARPGDGAGGPHCESRPAAHAQRSFHGRPIAN